MPFLWSKLLVIPVLDTGIFCMKQLVQIQAAFFIVEKGNVWYNKTMNKSIYSLEDIKNKLSPVFLLYNVKSAVLFGSYAKGYATESSDIDLLVDSNLKGLKFFALLEDVKEALDEKEVDLFDVTHIESGSQIKNEINNTGVRIYERY